MDKIEKDARIEKKAYDGRAVERALKRIRCHELCAEYPLCASDGRCQKMMGIEYERPVILERRLIL